MSKIVSESLEEFVGNETNEGFLSKLFSTDPPPIPESPISDEEERDIIAGKMDPIDVYINLDENEYCYFESRSEWHEYQTVTKRFNYGGLMGRIKIAPGIYFRIGSIIPNRVAKEELTFIDEGRVYFTNKRVIFDGRYKNKSISLNNIIGLSQYSNGLEIERSSGRSLFLAMRPRYRANLVLSSLLRGKPQHSRPEFKTSKDWKQPKYGIMGTRH